MVPCSIMCPQSNFVDCIFYCKTYVMCSFSFVFPYVIYIFLLFSVPQLEAFFFALFCSLILLNVVFFKQFQLGNIVSLCMSKGLHNLLFSYSQLWYLFYQWGFLPLLLFTIWQITNTALLFKIILQCFFLKPFCIS